jgi:hypothetical protein
VGIYSILPFPISIILTPDRLQLPVLLTNFSCPNPTHMRIALLSFVIVLFAQTTFAASRLPQSKSGLEESKPPKELYSKGKGTMGMVAALVLGPVGWLGVRVLSRNKTQRKKAGQGLAIWGTVVVTAAFIWLIVLSSKGGGGSPNFNFGGGGSSQKQKQKPQNENLPPVKPARFYPSQLSPKLA